MSWVDLLKVLVNFSWGRSWSSAKGLTGEGGFREMGHLLAESKIQRECIALGGTKP